MKKLIVCLLAACVLAGCAASVPQGQSANFQVETMLLSEEQIQSGKNVRVHDEAFGPWEREALTDLAQAEAQGSMGFDLRSLDVSKEDLNTVRERLARVTFDTDTKWPAALPSGFDPNAMLDLGKTPGLGVRALQERGITGAGVGIAIIDQSLLLDHKEYADRVMTYETLHNMSEGASMHGPAVTSIAAGSTCGVAPGANVYYIASTFGTFLENGSFESDLTYMAEGIRRVLEINKLLPEDKKIRVVSISKGFDLEETGGKAVYEAIEEAKKQGVFVITTSPENNYNFEVWGLGREAMANPDDPASFVPGRFWAESFYNDEFTGERMLLVPMDCRTTASFIGTDSYAYYTEGGLSWAVPWLAGLYALCVQQDTSLTPERFLELAFQTGSERTVEHEGKQYPLGVLVNPERLTAAVAGEAQ